jgi:RNA polymerase sigma factor for flagellar operon FliA
MNRTAMQTRVSETYGVQSRQEIEEKWILDHLPLVRHVVAKITAQMAYTRDVDDLVSAGTLGLVKAARSFDPTRQAEFKTYAYIRIRGSVLDELRGRSFVPSTIHKRLRAAQRAAELFEAENGRPPSDEELARALDVGLDELYKLLEDGRRQNFLSIHGLSDDQPALDALVPPSQGPGPDSQLERKELSQRLAKAIRELPERDRIVLLLYYERDLTMKETAKVLGVTESRVSQMHASAMFKLNLRMRNES